MRMAKNQIIGTVIWKDETSEGYYIVIEKDNFKTKLFKVDKATHQSVDKQDRVKIETSTDGKQVLKIKVLEGKNEVDFDVDSNS